MQRRLKRMRDFEVSLHIKNDGFIAPPRDAQRNWLLNRALAEFSSDLIELDRVSRDFVAGSGAVPLQDRTQASLDEQEIMEDWQFPIMRAMTEIVTETHGDVLEVGFGRGISADYIQEHGVGSHTIVECNDSIVERFHTWRQKYDDRDIRLIHARWQDAAQDLDVYDGVFFHTYPLNEDEMIDNIVNSTTFAEHFFPTAAAVLRAGGIFTYLTNEIDSFSRAHQRLVFQHFRSLTLRRVEGLKLPETIKDAWWADSMVVIKAEK